MGDSDRCSVIRKKWPGRACGLEKESAKGVDYSVFVSVCVLNAGMAMPYFAFGLCWSPDSNSLWRRRKKSVDTFFLSRIWGYYCSWSSVGFIVVVVVIVVSRFNLIASAQKFTWSLGSDRAASPLSLSISVSGNERPIFAWKPRYVMRNEKKSTPGKMKWKRVPDFLWYEINPAE